MDENLDAEDNLPASLRESNTSDFKLNIKPAFEQRYKDLLGDEGYSCFMEFSHKYIKKSIRVNTLKIDVETLKKRLEGDWVLTPVPWCSEGFWIEYRHGKRFDIGNLPEHQLGYIYVQDAASMIPPVVLSPMPNSFVLDMCAAPGSKTSQMSQQMNNTGMIVANESQGKRISALGINLQRCGITNVAVNHMDGIKMPRQELFDYVLVDAPCSGTGTLRRNAKIAEMWSPSLVARMVSTQRKLLQKGFDLLKPGGILVYSTCTLEPEENEVLISDFLNKNPAATIEKINLNIKRSPAVTEFEGRQLSPEVSKCLRIYPQDNDSEGFFVTKILKKEQE